MEFLLDYSRLVQFEPDESFLFAFFVERDSLGASGVDDRGSVDDFSLMIVKMARGEELEVSRDRRFLNMDFLTKVAVEAVDRIVCNEHVDVSVSVHFVTGERIGIGWQGWIEAHPCHVDSFTSEIEFLTSWALFLYEVEVSGPCVNGVRGGHLIDATWCIEMAAYKNIFDVILM